MPNHHPIASLAVATLLAWTAPSNAQTTPMAPPDAPAYAVVVGSNPGGPGQKLLRYAEDDAVRVARLLVEVSGFQQQNVRLLERPTPAVLKQALDDVEARLQADAKNGQPARFFFYYSGHARAHALNLGNAEMSLEKLREQLLSLPAHLTIVVLDACQSGAFSRVKGAEPAADFSFNSVAQLNASGVAVMASSSASELSQESEQLRSSYFTHHFLVALRGAGDVNDDGRVSLDEAYEYAYQRTLASTAMTAVGAQHVTLETDLSGKGDVPLSYPAVANSHLALPADLEADLLLQMPSSRAVVAELHKSRGQLLKLALPSGLYRAIVRSGGHSRSCLLRLSERRTTTLAIERCAKQALTHSVTKGGGPSVRPPSYWPDDGPIPRYGLEFSVGSGQSIEDDFTQRLQDFGFGDQSFLSGHLRFAGSYRWRTNVELVGLVERMETGEYRRSNSEGPHYFRWATWTAGMAVRLTGLNPDDLFQVYAQAGAGLGRTGTRYTVTGMPGHEEESFYGYYLSAAMGMHIMPWRRFGLSLQMDYDYAPILENLIGDTHDSGGLDLSIGVRAQF